MHNARRAGRKPTRLILHVGETIFLNGIRYLVRYDGPDWMLMCLQPPPGGGNNYNITVTKPVPEQRTLKDEVIQ